jgi:formylglycine-generating enzyme required for sulfatase activity
MKKNLLPTLLALLTLSPLLAADPATKPATPDPAIAGPTVLIEPGKFSMGSPETEPDRDNEEIQHPVRFTRPFFIGRHEVTVGQFKKFVEETKYVTDAERAGKAWATVGTNANLTPGVTWRAPGFEQTEQHPVVAVSCNDAQAYCAWLTKKLGQTCTLPSEAQWEFAARSGDKTPFGPGALDETTWRRENSDGKTHPVETKKPNNWGLFDTHGNAMEWTRDRYGPYVIKTNSVARNPSPKGPDAVENEKRSIRGGAWSSRDADCRSAARAKLYADSASNTLGFRIIILPPQADPTKDIFE